MVCCLTRDDSTTFHRVCDYNDKLFPGNLSHDEMESEISLSSIGHDLIVYHGSIVAVASNIF